MDWYVKKEDGSIYGPITFDELRSWTAEGRVAPEDFISSDQIEWISPSDKEDLHMDWTIEMEDGDVYGPIHLLAFSDFVVDGAIDIGATVTNCRHNISYPLAHVLLPALVDSNTSLRDTVGNLAAAVETARQEAMNKPSAGSATPERTPQPEKPSPEADKPPATVRNIAGQMKKAEHWEVLYRQETEKAEEREKELREQIRELEKDQLQLTTELDEVKSKLSNQQKMNAEFEKFSQAAEGDGDDRINILKSQFKHLLDTYNQISLQYETISSHVADQSAELEELRNAKATIQKNADKRIAAMTEELQHEREEADKSRSKLSSFEKNYTDLLKSYREMNDKLVQLRQQSQQP